MYFIAFEGLDGSGKSSLIKQLENWLSSLSVAFVTTREPGGTPLGDELRKLILSKSESAPLPRAELLLYEASRAQHVDVFIRPHLKAKSWVLTDRFSASSLAFQGAARDMGWDVVKSLNQFATDGLEPDLTVLLDLTVAESETRRNQRHKNGGEGPDRIESEAREFHEKVRQGFLRAANENPKNWLVLDAGLAPEELFEELKASLLLRGWVKK
jgi:dTMP kinase